MPSSQPPLSVSVSTHTSGLTQDASTQTASSALPLDPSSLPAPHSDATTDASTQRSISEFLQLCFTKHPFRRTVPLELLEDLSNAHGSSNRSNMRSVTFTDAATQLSFAEFFDGASSPRLYRRDLSHFPKPRTSILSTVSSQRQQWSHSGTSHTLQQGTTSNSWAQGTDIPGCSQPHLHQSCARTSSFASWPSFYRARYTAFTYSTAHPTATCQYHPKWGPHPTRSTAAHKRSAGTAFAGTHSAIGADVRAGRGPFPKPRPVVLPMVRFRLPKPAGHGYLHNSDSDLMHHQYRLSVLQWNPGPARRNPTQIVAVDLWTFSRNYPTRSK